MPPPPARPVPSARRPGLLVLVPFLFALLAAGPARADTCPGLFAEGRAPVLVNPRLSAEAVPLCYDAFALLHSGLARTPVYAAERLTRAGVAAARTVDRVDAFHEEARLPEGERASLSDYTRSGYDRGHMAPAGDMPTPEAQAQSFTLANIVPQDRTVNRTLWAAVEESVRRLATRRGTLFVVTGPIFSGASVRSIGAGVLVPTRLYKAVYDPARGEGAAYLVDNAADGDLKTVSLAELRTQAGLDAFPGASEAAKAQAMSLPEPREFSREAGLNRAGQTPFEAWLRRSVDRSLRRMVRDVLRSIFDL